MKRLAAVALGAVTLLVAVPSASAVTLQTKWVERTELSSGGTYTMYVRKIEITKARLYNTELSTTHQFKLPRRL